MTEFSDRYRGRKIGRSRMGDWRGADTARRWRFAASDAVPELWFGVARAQMQTALRAARLWLPSHVQRMVKGKCATKFCDAKNNLWRGVEIVTRKSVKVLGCPDERWRLKSRKLLENALTFEL